MNYIDSLYHTTALTAYATSGVDSFVRIKAISSRQEISQNRQKALHDKDDAFAHKKNRKPEHRVEDRVPTCLYALGVSGSCHNHECSIQDKQRKDRSPENKEEVDQAVE